MRSMFRSCALGATLLGLVHCNNVPGSPAAAAGADERGAAVGAPELLFSDGFDSHINPGLGRAWSTSGRWYSDGRAVSDSNGVVYATAGVATCGECLVQGTVLPFGVPQAGVFARSPSPSSPDGYQAVLLPDRTLRILRVRNGATSMLGIGLDAHQEVWQPAAVELWVSGANPVTIVGVVDGVPRVRVTDGSSSRITAPGYAGFTTTSAGVVFDDFRLFNVPPDMALPDPEPQPPVPGPDGSLFRDGFDRRDPMSLGAQWTAASGSWLTDGRAVSDRDDADLAIMHGFTCGNCRVEATVIGFGVPSLGLVLRASSAIADEDGYEVRLLGDGRIELGRKRGGDYVVLGAVPSGIASLGEPARIGLAATGENPVALTVTVDGREVLAATDGTADALRAAGYAGMRTTRAGVVFDDFVIAPAQ